MAARPTKGQLTTQISKLKMRKIWTEAFSRETSIEKFPFKGYMLTSIAINVLMIAIVLVLIYFKRIPPQVPIFYGSPEGEEQLAANWLLTTPALASTIFLGINFLISGFVEDDFLKKILIIAGITATILSTITTAKILFLIGYFR